MLIDAQTMGTKFQVELIECAPNYFLRNVVHKRTPIQNKCNNKLMHANLLSNLTGKITKCQQNLLNIPQL